MARPFLALALGAASLSTSALAAQESRPATTVDARLLDPPPSAEGRRYFDGVIAMIGDRAVLASTIKDQVDARVEGIYGAGGKVAPSDVEEFARDALRRQMHGEILAQSARTSTALTPEEVKEIVQKESNRYLDEQVALAGSFNEYMRLLAATGKTWEAVAQEHENDLLQSIAVQDIYNRTRQQVSLLVTPREMKRHYESKRADYVQVASADVQRVIFSEDAAGISSEARAKSAVAAWRARPDLSADELAKQFSGTALPLRKAVRDDPSDANAPFVKTFAGKAGTGDVSDPIGVAGSFWVLRVVAKTAGKNQDFGEAGVQRDLISDLAKRKQADQEIRLVMRNHRNLYVYPFDLLDR